MNLNKSKQNRNYKGRLTVESKIPTTAERKKTVRVVDKGGLDFRMLLLLPAIIGVLVFLCYLPALNNGFTNWDDPTYVVDNPLVVADHIPWNEIFTTPVSLNYHPLTILTLSIEHQLWGLSAGAHHKMNVLIHILNCVLVFFFIYMLSERKWSIAFITALFFGIHPMHVESVAWISERKDVLYSFFFLIACIVWMQYLHKPKIGLYVLCFAFFILSLLSKAMAVVLPVAFLLIDFYMDRKVDKQLAIEKIPFFIVSLIFGVVAFVIQSKGAVADLETFTFFQRLMFGSYGFLIYLAKLIAPVNLSAFYPYPVLDDNGNIPSYFYLAPFLVGLIFAAAYQAMKYTKAVMFGVAFFFVTAVLVLQFVSVGKAITADRYTYLPYIGIFFIAGYFFDQLLEGKGSANMSIRVSYAAVLLFFGGFFCVNTYARCKVWENSDTLWSDVISKYPEVGVAYKNRGNYYAQNNKVDLALKDYEILVQLEPNDPKAFSNLGNIYSLKGKTELSLGAYSKAIALDSSDFEVYLNRAITYSRINELDKAFPDFRKAASYQPDNPILRFNRGYAYTSADSLDEAIADYNFLIKKNSRDEKAYFYRGFAKFKKGNLEDALADFNIALSINPNNNESHFNKAVLLSKLNRNKEALVSASEAKRLGFDVPQSFMDDLKKNN